MLQRLRRSWHALDRPSACVLVGFSGGADSLALLGLAIELGRLERFVVEAVHIDHGLRDASGAEAVTARSTAQALGIDLHLRRLSRDLLATHSGVGREEAMRRERYRAFARVAAEVDAGLIVLAHHQRDQAETVLLHLLRGAGLRGASGMSSISTLPVPWWDEPVSELLIWRPLLTEAAEDVRLMAASLGLPIIEDASNQDISFRRNAIRHDLLPVLEVIAPGATINLARFAALARLDSDELDRQARDALNIVVDPDFLDRQWLLALPAAIQRRVIQFWIQARAPLELDVPLNRIEEVLRVASVDERVRIVEIGGGVWVEVSRNALTLGRDPLAGR